MNQPLQVSIKVRNDGQNGAATRRIEIEGLEIEGIES